MLNSFIIINCKVNLSKNKPLVRYQKIHLDGLSDLLHSSLVTGGADVPEGHYEQSNMKETVVPNRNKIFSSLIQAVALSVATKDLGDGQLEKRDVAIAMGIHAGDHAIYPDCRQEFRDADMKAFATGNWDSELVYHYTPYLNTDKFGILEDGVKCCEQLGFDFNEVYVRTNTSYKPIQFQTPIGPRWYSDYKSASSVERIEAFIKLGRRDPVLYANESGPVKWEVAKSHVEKILAEHNNK
jgi:7-cyano-7-deazaguanine synthase